MSIRSIIATAFVASALMCFCVERAAAQIGACDPNQYLYNKHIPDGSANDHGRDITRTTYNCGFAVVGEAPGSAHAVALDQTGAPLFSRKYSTIATRFEAVTESIEGGMPYLIAVGQGNGNLCIVNKIDAVSGTVIWERELSYTPLGGQIADIRAVDVVADNGEYYVLANTFDPGNTKGKDVAVIKLNSNGLSIVAFANHLWQPTVDPDAHMHAAAMKMYGGSLWITGWTEVKQSSGAILEETFLMRVNPNNGAYIGSLILLHSDDVADLHSRPQDLWVGDQQAPNTEFVIVGDLYTATQTPVLHGGFITRYNSTLGGWESRQVLAPSTGEEEFANAYGVDFGLNPKGAWVVAGQAVLNSLQGAYLLEFDENWAYTSAIYGRNNPESSTWTEFFAVATQGINGAGPSPTLDYSYGAVGLIDVGPFTQFDTYISKVDGSLQTADGCLTDQGPTLDPIFVVEDDWGFSPIDLMDNVRGEPYDEDWIDPDTYCEETIEIGPLKQGTTEQLNLLPHVRVNDDLEVGATADGSNGVQFSFVAGNAGLAELTVVDALGKTLATQNVNLVVGENTAFVPVRFSAAGMYYAQVASGGNVTMIPLSIVR